MNAIVTSDGKILMPLDDIIGSFRTFGPVGPVYEVLRITEPSTGPDVLVHIRVVESGEELDYPIRDAINDPLAR